MSYIVTGRGENPETGANECYRIKDTKTGSVKTVSRAEGVRLCEQGEMPRYSIYERNGVKYLRDKPDTREEDNIDKQPLINC